MVEITQLNLSKTTLDAISKKGFSIASEIQKKIIPVVFEQKQDIIGIAQTGTGKTAAFGLPLIDLVNPKTKTPESIILCPTRELALQVTAELKSYCGENKLSITTVYGGSSIQNQVKELKQGTNIVVGTPGRVVDLINRGDLVVSSVKYFVLDEADEMLKMGFIEDIEYVLENSSKSKLVYLFSATMPARIKQLSQKYMKNQVIIEAEKKKEISSLITHIFYKTKQSEKFSTLQSIIALEDFFYGIVFCKTKSDVEDITKNLKKSGIKADCIHGDIMQNRRERILQKFKDQQIHVLVATDVAARGIDVENLSHVINYNLPEDVESYTHRVGRTGRAGSTGEAISLVTPAEMRKLSLIEKSLKIKFQQKTINKKEVENRKTQKIVNDITKSINSVDTTHHMPLITELLNNHAPEKVIATLLEKLHSEDIKEDSTNTSSSQNNKNSNNAKQRVFIAKGKMDNLDARGLIRFVEKETKMRLGDVENIKICDKFSFMTLATNEAHSVVDHFESKNQRKPLAEIAQK